MCWLDKWAKRIVLNCNKLNRNCYSAQHLLCALLTVVICDGVTGRFGCKAPRTGARPASGAVQNRSTADQHSWGNLGASTAGLVKNSFISKQSQGKLVLKSTAPNVLLEELLGAGILNLSALGHWNSHIKQWTNKFKVMVILLFHALLRAYWFSKSIFYRALTVLQAGGSATTCASENAEGLCRRLNVGHCDVAFHAADSQLVGQGFLPWGWSRQV